MPDVVTISPDIAALAPLLKHFSPLFPNSPLPPANLIEAAGIINLNIATHLHTYLHA